MTEMMQGSPSALPNCIGIVVVCCCTKKATRVTQNAVIDWDYILQQMFSAGRSNR